MFEEDIVKDKRRALVESDQFADYLLGKKRLFGDEMGQCGPTKFLSLAKEEKWLESRAGLSAQQKESLIKAKADLRAGLVSHDDMKELMGKKLNEKAVARQ